MELDEVKKRQNVVMMCRWVGTAQLSPAYSCPTSSILGVEMALG